MLFRHLGNLRRNDRQTRRRERHLAKLGSERLEPRRMMAADLRTPLPEEGLLHYINTEALPYGNELTGYVGANSLSQTGPVDNVLGYNSSTYRVPVHLIIATLYDNAPTFTASMINKMFDYANSVFAQAGITIEHRGTDSIVNFNGTLQNGELIPKFNDPRYPLTIPNDPVSTMASALDMFKYGRAAVGTLNVYIIADATYEKVQDVDRVPLKTVGETVFPNWPDFAGNPLATFGVNDGILLNDKAPVSTFTHELSVMLLESSPPDATGLHQYRFDLRSTDRKIKYQDASSETNVLARGSVRLFGDSTVFYTPRSDINSAPEAVGQPNGEFLGKGGNLTNSLFRSELVNRVYFDKDNNRRRTPSEPLVSEADAMQHSRYVQKDTVNTPANFADQVDFTYVEDNYGLENLPSDPHQSAFNDAMVWTIAPADIKASPTLSGRPTGDVITTDTAHVPTRAFTAATFNTIDVVSLTTRYTDMDAGPDGHWSAEKGAFDYLVETSVDGSVWHNATFVDYFKDGFTDQTKADDFLVRWSAVEDAKYVRITALKDQGHDGNVQIDAIIVGNIPEVCANGFDLDTTTGNWYVNYSIKGSDGRSFQIDLAQSVDGMTDSVSLAPLTISGADAENGEHRVELGSAAQVDSYFPFLIGRIDVANVLQLTDTSHETVTSEGVYYDGAGGLFVYGSANADFLSFAGPIDDSSGTQFSLTFSGQNSSSFTSSSLPSGQTLTHLTAHLYGGDDYATGYAPFAYDIYAGSGNDILATSNPSSQPGVVAGNWFGEGGDDQLICVQTSATLIGGAGDDTYSVMIDPNITEPMMATVNIVEAAYQGTDFIDFSNLSQGIHFDLADTATQTLIAGVLAVKLNDGQTIENVSGTAFDDQLYGNDLDNEILASDGNDVVNGRGGANNLFVGTGADTVVFQNALAADTIISTSDGVSTVALDFSQQTLGPVVIDSGSTVVQDVVSGSLSLTLYATVNKIIGSSADDVITLSEGSLLVVPGSGHTTIKIVDSHAYYQTTRQLTFTGNATSTLDLSGLTALANVNLNTTSAWQDLTTDGSLQIYLQGTLGTIVGSAGGGTLTGNSSANHLVATGGTTTLIGGAGNDTLTFMGGTATIDPGSGANTIQVVDSAEYNVWGSIDLLASSGAILDLSGMNLAANVTLLNTTSMQTLATNADDSTQTLTLRLHSVPSILIGSSGGGSLIGTSGADTLVASDGNTTIDGGSGNDTFIVNGGNATINVVSVAGDTKTLIPDIYNSVTTFTSVNNWVYIDLKAAGQEMVMFRVYGDGNIQGTVSRDGIGRLQVTSTGTATMYNYYLAAAAGGFQWINSSGGLCYLDAVTSTVVKPDFNVLSGSVSFLTTTTVGAIETNGGGAYLYAPVHADSISVLTGVVYNGARLVTVHDLHIGQGLFFTGAHGSEGASALVIDSITMDRDSTTGNYLGKLDINNNVLIWHGGGSTGMAAVMDMLTRGSTLYNWWGYGLSGASSQYTGLGVLQNNTLIFVSNNGSVTSGGSAFYSTFAGQAVSINDVFVKYTWLGDTDLDGAVTAVDYALIDTAFALQTSIGNPVSGWVNGDFNRNGSIDAGDYALIDLAFAHQTGVL